MYKDHNIHLPTQAALVIMAKCSGIGKMFQLNVIMKNLSETYCLHIPSLSLQAPTDKKREFIPCQSIELLSRI